MSLYAVKPTAPMTRARTVSYLVTSLGLTHTQAEMLVHRATVRYSGMSALMRDGRRTVWVSCLCSVLIDGQPAYTVEED